LGQAHRGHDRGEHIEAHDAVSIAVVTLRPVALSARGLASALLAGAGVVFFVFGITWSAFGAEPVPVNVRTMSGRFDISAVDASLAHNVSARAEETWRHLSALLTLPEGFSSPLFVRISAGDASRPLFTAQAEPGGIVSIWISSSAVAQPAVVRRALARGLLLRLGVAWYGADAVRTVPAWLELGCAVWVDTREFPARLDEIKDRTRSLAPPALGALLNDNRAVVGGLEHEMAALWLLTFLQTESGGAREWEAFLRGVLRGTAADEMLTLAFPGRFAHVRDRELWWQTGWHHVRRVNAFPMMDSQESAQVIVRLARFIFAPGNEDRIVPLRTVLEYAADAIVADELRRRAAELQLLAPALHPYYRNAGLSLLEVFLTGKVVSAKRQAALIAAFEEDWRDGIEIEAAAKAALDAFEQARR
jgi:hypothetical protein